MAYGDLRNCALRGATVKPYGILYMVVLPGGARASEHRTVVERCVYIHVHILPDAGPGGRGGARARGSTRPEPPVPGGGAPPPAPAQR